jgi:hypothetical protein
MLSDEHMLGVDKTSPTTMKPLKVRLPLAQVLQLHRMRIVGDRTVSEIVEDALEQYLDGIQKEIRERKEATS